MWEEWLAVAGDSLFAGLICENDAPRSASSRYYYAAYQAATALLHYLHVQPPAVGEGADREAWSHAATPAILETHIERIEKRSQIRRELRACLTRLYRIRIRADYHPAGENFGAMKKVRRDAEYLVKYAREVLVSGRTTEQQRQRERRRR